MTRLREHSPQLYLTELHLDDFDVRGAVILGSQRVVVWDTLSHPRDMQPLLALVQGQRTTVVYTHADWDHVWGTAGIPRQEVIAHDACYERFQNDVPLTLQAKKEAEQGKWDAVALISPTLTFSRQLIVDLGDVTLELHHLPGHTLDCIVGFIPEWGVLLAGDTAETPLPVVNEDSPIETWIKALQGWEQDTRVKTVIPAHGDISDRTLFTRNIAYLNALLSGEDFALPAIMHPFYHETHAKNLEYVRAK
jgi:glyoxylase-like metal-dependent hydrolase (beta-lactamase superfamily II)